MKLRIWMLQLYELFLYLTTAKELKVDISTKQISVAPSSPQLQGSMELLKKYHKDLQMRMIKKSQLSLVKIHHNLNGTCRDKEEMCKPISLPIMDELS